MKKKYYKTLTCPECGKVRTVLTSSRGILCKSCSNSRTSKGRSLLDITGMRFGKLVAIERAYIKNKGAYWKCSCDCGNDSIHSLSHLRSGNTKSCGCLSRKLNGKSQTKTYKSYGNMIRRCYNEKLPHYKRYGGAGITVCDRWRDSYLNFLDDMGERPEGTSIDRIDCSGNYTKENCRWATPQEQARNKTSNKCITYNGVTATLAEWSEKTGIEADTLSWRILRGWTPEEALTLSESPLVRAKKTKNNKFLDPQEP